MSRFIGRLDITPTGKKMAIVNREFLFNSDVLDASIVIPAGFVTDGASVPWIFWLIIPPWGIYGQAAVIHDYLYRWQHTGRRNADDALLEGMLILKSNWWKQAIIYVAVRIFGHLAWRSDKKKPLSAEELLPNAGLIRPEV